MLARDEYWTNEVGLLELFLMKVPHIMGPQLLDYHDGNTENIYSEKIKSIK